MSDAFKISGRVDVDTSPAERGLANLGKQVADFGSSIKSGLAIGASIVAIQEGLDLLGAGFGALKSSVLDFNQTIDMANTTFLRYFKGNQEAASDFMTTLQSFANTSPFEFKDLVPLAVKLQNANTNAKDIIPTLQAIGNASSATGQLSKTSLDRISLALTQMSQTGHVTGQDMRQLTEALVPAWQILADATGKPIPVLQKLASAGQISSQTFLDAFRQYYEGAGLMEAASKTLSGALSTVSDVGTQALAEIGHSVYQLATEGANQLATFLQTDQFKVWVEAGRTAMEGLADGVRGLLGYFAPLGEAIKAAFGQATSGDFSGAFSTLGDGFKTQLGQIYGDVTAFASQMLGAGENVVQQFADGMLSGGFAAVQSAIDTITTFIADWLIGHSPPKEGPLSQIDAGGTNTAKAFTDAFSAQMQSGAQKGVEGFAATIATLKDMSRDVAGQIREITDQTQDLDRTMAGLREKITGIKDAFAQSTAGVREAASETKTQYAGAIQAVRDQIDTIKDAHEKAASAVQHQIDDIKTKYGDAIEGVKGQITSIQDKYNGIETSIQRQIDQVKDRYGDAIASLQAKITATKEHFDGIETSLSRQIDAVKNKFGPAIDALQQKISDTQDSYAKQEDALQKLIDTTQDQYGAAIDGVQAKIDATKDSYSKQEDVLQRLIDSTSDRYASAIDAVQAQIDATTDSYGKQEDALQKVIDATSDRYAAAISSVQRQIDDTRAGYSKQEDAVQRLIDQTQDKYVSALSAVQSKIDGIRQTEEDQLAPLQAQLTALQDANKYLRERQDAESAIKNAKLEQLQLDALGDPALRAQLSGRLAVLNQQQQQVDLAQQLADAQAKLAAGGLSPLDQQALNLKIQQIQVQQQLANLVNQSLLGQAASTQVLNDAEKQRLATTNQIADANTKIAEIPLEQQIAKLQAAATDALKPLTDQLAGIQGDEKSALDPLQAHLKQLKQDSDDALAPLNDRLKSLQREQEDTLGPLQAALKSLKADGDAALAPLTEQLKTLQGQQKAALDPLQAQLKGLKSDADAALDPLQDQLKTLQANQKAALDPLQAALKLLKSQADDTLTPLQDQLKGLQRDQKAALDPLELKLQGVKAAADDALTPLQAKLKGLESDQKAALDPLQDSLRKAKNEEADLLVPLQSRLKSLETDQKNALEPLQQRLRDIKDDEKAALDPLEERVKGIQAQAAAADHMFDAMLSAIAAQQREILTPLEQQLTAYQHQKDALTEQRQELERIKSEIAEQIALTNEAIRAAKGGGTVPGAPNLDFPVDKAAEAAAEKAKAAGATLAAKVSEGIAGWFQENKTHLVESIIGFIGGAALFGPLGAVAGAAFLPEFIDSLNKKLQERGVDVQPMIQAIADGIKNGDFNPLGEALGYATERAIFGTIPAISRVVVSWVKSLFSGDNSELQGALKDLGNGFLGGFVKGIVDNPMDVAETILTVIFLPESWLRALGGVLARIPIAGRFLSWLFDGFASAGNLLRGGGASPLETVWTTIADAFGDGLLGSLARLPGRIGSGIVSAIRGLFGAGGSGAAGAAEAVTYETVGGEAASSFVNGMVKALPGEIAEVGSVVENAFVKSIAKIDPVADLADAFKALGGSWTKVGTVIEGEFEVVSTKVAPSLIDGLIDGITSALPKLWAFLKGGLGVIQTLKAIWRIMSPSGETEDLGGFLVDGLLQGLTTGWTSKLKGWLDGFGALVITTVTAPLGGPVQWLVKAGEDTVSGLQDGIQSFWDTTAKPWLSGAGSWVTDAVRAYVGGPLQWLVATGGDVLTGLQTGAQAFWDQTLSPWFGGAGSWVVDAFRAYVGGPAAWLVQTGQDTLQGLRDGAQRQWDTNVQPWLQGAGSWIVNAFTTYAGGPARWLLDAGSNVIGGLKDGMAAWLNGDDQSVLGRWIQENLTDALPTWVRKFLGINSPSRVFMDIGSHLIEGLISGMESKAGDLMKAAGGIFGGLGGSADVDAVINAAIKITGVGDNWLDPMKRLVQLESGGDPTAVNQTDVFGVLNGPGPHAKGLLQVIDPTFQSERDPALPDDIFNPLANAVASIHHIIDAWGSPWDIPGVTDGDTFGGYAAGGWAGLHGPELAWLGEKGPEYVVSNDRLSTPPSDWMGGTSRSGGGDVTIVVNINGSVMADKRAIQEAVMQGVVDAVGRRRLSPSVLINGG